MASFSLSAFKGKAKRLDNLLRFLFSSDRTFLTQVYREIFGRQVDEEGLNHFLPVLESGQSRLEVILSLLRSEEFYQESFWKLFTKEQNQAFLEEAYQRLFGRPIDEEGLKRYGSFLQQGKRREEILFELISSDELVSKILQENIGLKNIRILKPSQYIADTNLLTSESLLTFKILDPQDFDWLETMIRQNAYYERPGIWSYGLDSDKQRIAEIAADFSPQKVLEIGCSSGAILKALYDRGVEGEGVEISAMAIQRAFPEIKDKIHEGDLLEIQLSSGYDLVLGLDIFEHLNPNKMNHYVQALSELLKEGGYCFCNIPVFGQDSVFGTVFPLYLKDWKEPGPPGRLFQTLHVDESGYPRHGHLIWADSHWWVTQFKKVGLVREEEIERALHQKYDPYFDRKAPARKSFYVFSRIGDPLRNQEIIKNVQKRTSPVLGKS
jgi:SAM-dependent methyltransferase